MTFPRVRRALAAGPVDGDVPGVARTEARVDGLAPDVNGVEVPFLTLLHSHLNQFYGVDFKLDFQKNLGDGF